MCRGGPGRLLLYQDHPDLPVLPASNMKLLTATCSWTNSVPTTPSRRRCGRCRPVKGVLGGDLYFVGGGDPLLREPATPRRLPPGSTEGKPVFTNVTELVGDLEARGVHEVTGSVVGDDSRYDSLRSVPGWPARYVEEGDAGALSALGIDDGFAEAGPPVPAGVPPAVQSARLSQTCCARLASRSTAPRHRARSRGCSLDRQVGFAPARRDPGRGAP